MAAVVIYGIDRIFRLIWGLVFVQTTSVVCKDAANQLIQVKFPKHKLAVALKVTLYLIRFRANTPFVELSSGTICICEFSTSIIDGMASI